MKLYTEAQLRKAYNDGCWDGYNDAKDKENDTINALAAIQIPSDRHAEKELHKHTRPINYHVGFMDGVNFARDFIDKQINQQP